MKKIRWPTLSEPVDVCVHPCSGEKNENETKIQTKSKKKQKKIESKQKKERGFLFSLSLSRSGLRFSLSSIHERFGDSHRYRWKK